MVRELHSLTSGTKTILLEIADQAATLATGLQNAAPPQPTGPSRSVLYLNEIAAQLEELCRSLDNPAPVIGDDL